MEVSRGQWPPPSPLQRRTGQQLVGPAPERVTYTLSVGSAAAANPSTPERRHSGDFGGSREDGWRLFRPDEASVGNSPIFVAKGVFKGPSSPQEEDPLPRRRSRPQQTRRRPHSASSSTAAATYDPFTPSTYSRLATPLKAGDVYSGADGAESKDNSGSSPSSLYFPNYVPDRLLV